MEGALSNPYLWIAAGAIILSISMGELALRLLDERTLADRIAELTLGAPEGAGKHTRSLLGWMQVIAMLLVGISLIVAGSELLGN